MSRLLVVGAPQYLEQFVHQSIIVLFSAIDGELELLDACKALLYALPMIKSFAHKGLETYFQTGSKKVFNPHMPPSLDRNLLRSMKPSRRVI